MASVSEQLAKEIIAKNGYYEDDPRVQQVVSYTNAWGNRTWAILYKRDVEMDRYAASEYVRNPKVEWEAK